MTISGFVNMTATGKNPLFHQKKTWTSDFGPTTDHTPKIEIPINKSAPYNSVNIVNKLVTVFAFAPARNRNSLIDLTPETRICKQSKSCTMTTFWLRPSLHRDTAPVSASRFCNPDLFVLPSKFLPRHSSSLSSLYTGAKTRAILSLHRD